ncbi:hypothetical protein [Scytonema sp. PCC 10023]|uniref:hypothetical protein n=1 Tax=Scytonema sp. PCC 10023 TaxID=1680591 RepID=UPI0039C69F80
MKDQVTSLFDLKVLTPAYIRTLDNNNYEQAIHKIFCNAKVETLENGMRILEGGGENKILVIPGFQSNLLTYASLLANIFTLLPPQWGYLIFDLPGVGLNQHSDVTQAAQTDQILLTTIQILLRKQKVNAIVPVSLSSPLVFRYLTDLYSIVPSLKIIFLVPYLLPSPTTESAMILFFNFFLWVYERLNIRAYRAYNTIPLIDKIWKSVIAPNSKASCTFPLQSLSIRLSNTPWTPYHYITLISQMPLIKEFPRHIKSAFILGKYDNVAQPDKIETWIRSTSQNSPIYWLESNHSIFTELPDKAAMTIVETIATLNNL